MPVSDISSVRGIGVALSVSTSTSVRSFLIRSLCCTPKRCSSSTTSSPRFLNIDVVGEQAVRADHDVDAALLDALDDLVLLLGAQEPRQHLDPHRIVREPLPERLPVLAREQRGRHEHRDLRAVEHRLGRGAQRDLGLAVADVAADQPVHRDRPLHVGLRLLDRLQLVGRLLVRERLLDLLLERAVGRERVTRCREPAAVEDDELGRDVAHRLADPRTRLLPVRAAHLRELRFLAAGVLADEPDVLGVDVDAVAALELDDEAVARDAEHLARFHAEVAADAVHAVHDEVAGGEALVVVLALRRAPRGVRCTRRRPVRSASAMSARCAPGSTAPRSSGATTTSAGAPTSARICSMRVFEPLPSAATSTRKPSLRNPLMRDASPSTSPTTGSNALAASTGVSGLSGVASSERGAGLGVREQTLERQRQARRGVRIADTPRRRERVRERGLLVEQLLGAVAQPARLHDRDERARRQQVGEEVLVGASATAATTPSRRRSAPRRAVPTARGPTARCASSSVARARTSSVGSSSRTGKNHASASVAVRTLVGDREVRQPVDLVAPEVDAHRMVGRRRVDVDDRTAHRELAARLDLVLAAIAHRDEPFDELVAVDLRAGRRRRSVRRPRRAGPSRCTSARIGATTTCGQVLATRAQPPHDPQAAAHRLGRGRDPFERQRLPRREQLDRVVAEVLPQVARDPLRLGARRHREQHRPPRRRPRERRGEDGARGLGHGHRVTLPGRRRDDRRIVGEQCREPREGRCLSHAIRAICPGCAQHPGSCVSFCLKRRVARTATSASNTQRRRFHSANVIARLPSEVRSVRSRPATCWAICQVGEGDW